MNFKELVIGAFLIGLFMFAIFSAERYFSQDNDITSITETNQYGLNSTWTNIETKLGDQYAQANESKLALQEEGKQPLSSQFGLVFSSVISGVSQFYDVTIGMFSIMLDMIKKNLGLSAIVVNTLLAIIIAFLFFAAWRAFRAGE